MILATVTAAQVLSVASVTIVAVALPTIARELDASGTAQQWVIDAFVLVFASLLVVGGVIGDRRGRRTTLIAGLALFAAGSLWCALAPTAGWLIAGRVIQAAGPALALPASLAIIGDTYPDRVKRARAIGLWAAGSGLGLTLGPLAGGLLTDGFGWRSVFFVNVLACGALIFAARLAIPRDRIARSQHPFDFGAAITFTVGVALLVFAVIEGRGLGWSSAPVVGAAAGAAALAAVFVQLERHHPAPLIDLRIVRQPTFAAANLGGAIHYGGLTGLTVYYSVFFQQVQGRSAVMTGLCLLPLGVPTLLLAPLTGRLTARIGPRLPITIGMSLACVAVLLLLRTGAETPFGELSWRLALLGLSTCLALPAMTVAAVAAAPTAVTGMAAAVHNTSRQLGQTFLVAVTGTVILSHAGEAASTGHRLTGAGADAWVDGLHVALWLVAVLLAAGAAAVALLIPRQTVAAPGRPGAPADRPERAG